MQRREEEGSKQASKQEASRKQAKNFGKAKMCGSYYTVHDIYPILIPTLLMTN